ncbi:MAG: NAD(P)-dependent oxidoreductase [Thermoleophilaceae bacterium]|nr:NAD(P)-dependent oxidoreductase [Thermoleophilaceae bacterium]
MRVFVAGATGALGRRLVPKLVERGHEVVGMTRSSSKARLVRELGAEPVVADALERDAVMRAVLGAEPEVVVHELTSLSGGIDLRRPDRAFEATNRLRVEGTDHLLAAAVAAGARRLVAQSYAGWPFERRGGWVKTEDDPLDPDPPKVVREAIEAIRHVETVVPAAQGIEGLVLRYGGFYGPGTSLAPGGEHLELVRRRKFPIVGDGAGVWSMIHIDDAAEATAIAVERGAPGIYNIVDDDPAPVREWLPRLAEVLGAKPPRRLPTWLGRIVAGEAVVTMMTEIRGASNQKAKRELGWHPRHPSWREGFAEAVA